MIHADMGRMPLPFTECYVCFLGADAEGSGPFSSKVLGDHNLFQILSQLCFLRTQALFLGHCWEIDNIWTLTMA